MKHRVLEGKRAVVHVDMDGVLCDYDGAWARAKEESGLEFPQSQQGFFYSLEPLPGAIEGFKWLWNHPLVDAHILTAPSPKNAYSYTEKRLWIEKHLGMDVVYKTTLAVDKSLVAGDYLIDDRLANGQLAFKGELIRFGSGDHPNWIVVREYLDKQLSFRFGRAS